MKKIWRWLVAIALYSLLFTGATDLFPMIAHIHHNDLNLPAAITLAINAVVFPFGIGYLLAMCLRRELLGSVWPLILAPFLLHTVTGYVTDSFYPPYSTDFLSLFLAGAPQGLCASFGWLVCQRFGGRQFMAPIDESSYPPPRLGRVNTI